MASASDSEDYSSYEEPVSFIQWLTERPATNWLCEVENAFIGTENKRDMHHMKATSYVRRGQV